MRWLTWLLLIVSWVGSQALGADAPPPKEWIDPDTGHRVVRLSDEPDSESFYFNVNPYTPDGKKMVFTSPSGIFAIDLATRKIETVVEGQRLRVVMVGRKTGQVYYNQRTIVFAADLETKEIRKIAELPFGHRVSAVNSDETLLAGTNVIMDEKQAEEARAREEAITANTDSARKNRTRNLEQRYNDRLPMELFFYNVKTGEINKFNRCNDWLNHLLFSPTDPNLLMFCHEGPWHKVDRIWLIHSDGAGLANIHKRTMNMEIAGHEFWGADGQTAWYDLQTPRGEDFWVAGYNVASGDRTWYHLERDQWSVHFNVSPDGKLFCGDGGSEGMVAHAENGKWIYLFHPEPVPDDAGPSINRKGLIKPGVFRWERLVNMAKHDYALEPNAIFTPDMKWIVFRSNMFGPSYVFAVEVAKAGK
ncbi:MAG: oligogalacturonate lyase family protein [Thermoguttaceae bacterium]|jgi:oligogalacturonide lyase